MVAMKESALQFGKFAHLAGIVTEPAVRTHAQGWVFVSAGLNSKAGPFGLYAKLARRMSAEGYTCLRFDLGGIGDSADTWVGEGLRQRTRDDIRAAVDEFTQRYALEGVILCGLCSGAEDSFRYAEHDPRVTGLVMIDPFAYRTSGWKWINVFRQSAKRIVKLLQLYVTQPPPSAGPELIEYKYMDRTESGRIMRAIEPRKPHLHAIYTGAMNSVFNHRAQFRAMFPEIDFGDWAQVDYFPRLGHTQMLEEDRQMVIDTIAARNSNRSPP